MAHAYIDVLRFIGLAIPDAHALKDFAIEDGSTSGKVEAIRFSYHRKRFRVTLSLYVEEVQGNILSGTDAALALSNCLHALDQLDDARNVLYHEATCLMSLPPA